MLATLIRVKPLRDMNPTLRGFLIIAAISGAIVVLQLEQTLVAIGALLQIAFFLAIAFFVYMVWRERRGEISEWSTRARTVFYGAALLILADFGAFWYDRPSGPDALAFFLVLGFCGFAMWRVWKDQHTYA
jgi:small-conductance mechanosensitive channel